MITENVSTLVINKLSNKQYKREHEAGNIDNSALYLTPDETDQSYNPKSENAQSGIAVAEAISGIQIPSWAKDPNKPSYTASEVGADAIGTANSQVSAHNTNAVAHNDIRLELQSLANKLNAFLNSDDTTLDELSELITAIKNNQTTISQLTSGKVNTADIIDNLTTNVTDKPLSAAQGVALKSLVDDITIPTKVSELTNDTGYLTNYTENDPTVPSWAKEPNKPSYTASEVGAVSTTELDSAMNNKVDKVSRANVIDYRNYSEAKTIVPYLYGVYGDEEGIEHQGLIKGNIATILEDLAKMAEDDAELVETEEEKNAKYEDAELIRQGIVPFAYKIHLDPKSIAIRDGNTSLSAGIRKPYNDMDTIYYGVVAPLNYIEKIINDKVTNINNALSEVRTYIQGLINGGAEFRPKAGSIKQSAWFQSPDLSDESIQSIVYGLANLTGSTAQTLIVQSTVYNTIVENDWDAIITAKNWILVSEN